MLRRTTHTRDPKFWLAACALVGAMLLTACTSSDTSLDTQTSPTDPSLTEIVPDPAAPSAEVERVVDGDTIIVRFGDTRERIRLLGIDTPESVDPNRPQQCFGAEASDEVKTLLPEGTEVTIERDVEARDQHGRILGYVFRNSDGLFINLHLLRRGYADLSIYPPNDYYRTELSAAFTAAQTSETGLWGACDGPDQPIEPDVEASAT